MFPADFVLGGCSPLPLTNPCTTALGMRCSIYLWYFSRCMRTQTIIELLSKTLVAENLEIMILLLLELVDIERHLWHFVVILPNW